MEKKAFYINKSRSIQREVFTKKKKMKNKTTLVLKKKKENTIVKNLKTKPQREDPLSALVEEEEPRRWSPWQDPWLYQAQGGHQK